MGDPAHSALVRCAEKHRPIQKAEAGIEPEFSALPRQYSAEVRPSRAGLVRAFRRSHPHPPVFPGGVRHPCDKAAHTPGPYARLMEAATRAAPRKSAGFHVCRTTSESGGAESAPKRPILAEEAAKPGFCDRI